MIKAAQISNMFRLRVRQKNDREVFIEDTGWVPYVPPTAYWRLVNTTLSCTGGITHEMPEDIDELSPGSRMPNMYLALAVFVAVLVYWVYKGEHFLTIEQKMAIRRNYRILNEIGSGQSGRVYEGMNIRSGKKVAIKIIHLKPNDWEHLASSWRECLVMSSLREDKCINVYTYYGCNMEIQGRARFWQKVYVLYL